MSELYDVVVIGAGIHGAGVAQAAAAAGYRVLVLEQTAVAAGTSSRSSKLIHGGLRYLETGQLRLVRESLRERELLRRLAPTLVWPLAFHLPIYHTSTRRPLTIRAGLSLYAVLAGLGRGARFTAVPRRAWADLDGLDTHGLQAVFRYFDAQTDDAALTRAVMRSATRLGATLVCPARFVGGAPEPPGIYVEYQTGDRTEHCRARALVNAAGPWAHQVLRALRPTPPLPPIELVQGAHIVMPGALGQGAYYVEAHDHRPVFVLPHGAHTLVGTTETTFGGDPARAEASPIEIGYLQTTFARYFPAAETEPIARFAGVRALPAGGGTYGARARDTLLHASGPILSIYGGKLTGYRATAKRALQRLRSLLPPRRPLADTEQLPLE